MLKKLKLKNYNLNPPEGIRHETINIDINNFIKHYLDENVPNFDQEDRDYYIKYFRKKILPGNFFSLKEDAEHETNDLKRDFAASYGKALTRSILDVYCNIPFFDHFNYYTKDKFTRKRYVSDSLLARVKNKDRGHPYFVAADTLNRLFIVGAKGRNTNYYKKDLVSYIAEVQNGVLVNKNGEPVRMGGWTVPTFISFGGTNSSCSIVQSNFDSQINHDSGDFSVFRGHYRKVFHNLNHSGLSNYLYGTLEHYGEEYKRTMTTGRILLGNSHRRFILEPVTFDCSTEMLYKMNFPERIFEHQTRRRNLVYGLDLEVAESIAMTAGKGSFNFKHALDKLEKFDINGSRMLGLSSDGTIIATLNQFDQFAPVDI